jgi:hypothetical protein
MDGRAARCAGPSQARDGPPNCHMGLSPVPPLSRPQPQSVLSPVFMSRKQRALACELDEPARWGNSRTGRALRCAAATPAAAMGVPLPVTAARPAADCAAPCPCCSTTAFHARARRRTGLQRLVASMFGCFVPPPGSRSPVPPMGTLGSGRSVREVSRESLKRFLRLHCLQPALS